MAVYCLPVWVSSCMGWAVCLMAVICLAISAMIWRGCETNLLEVSCLAACAMTPRDCWSVLKKEPADWVTAERYRVWEVSLVARKDRRDSSKS